MKKAFVLGAGLGERLRPLTEQLPKPLIPVFHKPLITYAFDHLLAGGVEEFIVNTHHLPAAYAAAFPASSYRGAPISFRHEAPVRLETAGGIANVHDLLGDEPFIVYNGDILTDISLQSLMRTHEEQGNRVTLALRSSGPALHISIDEKTGRLTDIRNKLGTGRSGEYLFTGIYACSPEFHQWLTPGKVESVIPIFLRMIQEGAALGSVVLDDGQWWDLGSRQAYLQAHQALSALGAKFPAYGCEDPVQAIANTASIAPGAQLLGLNVLDDYTTVGAGATLENCILWPHAIVSPNAKLKDCIIRSGMTAGGHHTGKDF